jgi:hypothetical protein
MDHSGLDLSGLEREDRRWLYSFAAGSPGTAELTVQTGLIAWRRQLAPMLEELDRGRFPIELAQVMAKLAEDWAAAWVERPGNEHASKDAANKAGARQMFRLLAEHYRGRLRQAHDGAHGPSLRAIDLICEAERLSDSNVQMQFVMENLAAQISAASA